MRPLHFLAALLLSGCVRAPTPLPTRAEREDASVQIPSFHEQAAVEVGKPGEFAALDGATLQALTVAANDFLLPESQARLCWQKRGAHRFKVLRQGDLVFVSVSLMPGACRLEAGLLGYGARYAIGSNGRILRRLDADNAAAPALPSQASSEDAHDAKPATTAMRAELDLKEVAYDGETLSGQLMIGAVGGHLRLDKRLVENIDVLVDAVRECSTGLPATHSQIHGFPHAPRQEDILTLEPGSSHGAPVHFALFSQRLGYPGPDCIDITLSLRALDGSLAGRVSARAERSAPPQTPATRPEPTP